jgi:hypothetical protein
MRRAGWSTLLFLGALGCQSAPTRPPQDDLLGTWLRNDGSFTNGVSKSGGTSSFEQFQPMNKYVSVVHTFSEHFDEYAVIYGSWNLIDGQIALAYKEMDTISLKSKGSQRKRVAMEGMVLNVKRIDRENLEYVDPTNATLSFVRGAYPPDFDPKVIDPKGRYFKEAPVVRDPGRPFGSRPTN